MEISTIVDFIGVGGGSPDVPVNPEFVNGSAQTGDALGFVIGLVFVLACLGALAYMFVARRSLATDKAQHANISLFNSNNRMTFIIAAALCAFVLIASSLCVRAYAASTNDDVDVTVTDKITCEVDKDSGATDMSKCVVSITNNGEIPITLQNIRLDLIGGETDYDSVWHIYYGDNEIYGDVANNYASIENGIIVINPSNSKEITFGLEMDADTAKSYIDKQVAKVGYEFIEWESTINGVILCQPDTFVSCSGSFTNKETGEVTIFETDDQGKFTINLPPSTDGIFRFDLETDKGHYFYKNWETSPENKGQKSFNRNLVGSSSPFAIATAGGTFREIPDGWVDDSSGEEGKRIKANWANGCPVYLILEDIDPTLITPPADSKFAKWNTNSGLHPSVNEVSPVWVGSSTIELTGNVVDVNGNPVSGVNVDICESGSSSPVFSTNTDLAGAYSLFVNNAGSYTIKFSSPTGSLPSYFAPNENIEVSESKDLGTTIVYEGINILNRISNSDGTQYDLSNTAHVSFVDVDGQVLSEQDIYYDTYYSYPVYNFDIPKSGKGIIKHDMPDDYLDFIFDYTEHDTGTQRMVKNTTVYKVSEASTIKGNISPAKEGIQVSFRLSDGSEFVTTTNPDGSYNLLVPPNQDGTFIVKDPELGTYYEAYTSGGTGATLTKDKDMSEKYLVTVDLKDGHISPAGVPEGWAKLSSVRYEKVFVAGSTFSYIMGAWDTKLITNPDPLYAFAAWDVNMDSPLQSETTVTALYGGYFKYETVSGITTQESGNLAKAQYKSMEDEDILFKASDNSFSSGTVNIWSPDGKEKYGSVTFNAVDDFVNRKTTYFKFKYVTDEWGKFILEHIIYTPLTVVPDQLSTITDAIPIFMDPTGMGGAAFDSDDIEKLKEKGFVEREIYPSQYYYSRLLNPNIKVDDFVNDLTKMDILPEGSTRWYINWQDPSSFTGKTLGEIKDTDGFVRVTAFNW